MKRIMKKLGLIMMIVVLGTTLSFAQNRGEQRNFDPEEMAKRQTEQLTELLELDKAQAKKVQELNLKAGKEMAAVREEMRDSGGNREVMREKMTEMRKKQNAEMKKVLSEEQYKKYQKYLEERRSQRGSRGSGDRR